MKSRTLLIFLVATSFVATASAQTKISGTAQCSKPNQALTAQVGDHPGHMLGLFQWSCDWTKPMQIAGVDEKSYMATVASEDRGETGRNHGYVVDTMANGDKAFIRITGAETLKDGAPTTVQGEWRYTSGTGKLKGIKGGGTYKATAGADGTYTNEVEGEYTITPRASRKAAK